ncbi:hypothetical protein BC828DRAFT_184341 [Blastocladiella britannica]|nr:hypothetical protein BC828DRAFT_184341 [Blastocladiella britannica]
MMQEKHLVDLSLNWAQRQPGGDENLAPRTHAYDNGNKTCRIDYCFVSDGLCQMTRSITTHQTTGRLSAINLDHAMIHAVFDTGPLWDLELRTRIHRAQADTRRVEIDADACTPEQLKSFVRACNLTAREVLPRGDLREEPVDRSLHQRDRSKRQERARNANERWPAEPPTDQAGISCPQSTGRAVVCLPPLLGCATARPGLDEATYT